MSKIRHLVCGLPVLFTSICLLWGSQNRVTCVAKVTRVSILASSLGNILEGGLTTSEFVT